MKLYTIDTCQSLAGVMMNVTITKQSRDIEGGIRRIESQ